MIFLAGESTSVSLTTKMHPHIHSTPHSFVLPSHRNQSGGGTERNLLPLTSNHYTFIPNNNNIHWLASEVRNIYRELHKEGPNTGSIEAKIEMDEVRELNSGSLTIADDYAGDGGEGE